MSVDCKELRNDINTLKANYKAVEEKLNKLDETGDGGEDWYRAQRAFEGTIDKVIENYLPDFAEKNPELNEYSGKEITAFVGKSYKAMVNDGDEIAVCSNRGPGILLETYNAKSGEYKTKNIGPNDCRDGVNVMIKLKNTETGEPSYLIGGTNGLLYENDEPIEGFTYTNGEKNQGVLAMAELPSGGVLIGGQNGMLYRFERENGKLVMRERIEVPKTSDGKKGRKHRADIYSIAVDENGNAIVGGRGCIYGCLSDQDGNYICTPAFIEGENISSVEVYGSGRFLALSPLGPLHFIDFNDNSVRDTRDGSYDMLVGDGKGNFVLGNKESGAITLLKPFDEFSDWKVRYIAKAQENGKKVSSLSMDKDGEITVGYKKGGATYYSHKPTIESLKKHLMEILEKGER